jgi:hypothetical protein
MGRIGRTDVNEATPPRRGEVTCLTLTLKKRSKCKQSGDGKKLWNTLRTDAILKPLRFDLLAATADEIAAA